MLTGTPLDLTPFGALLTAAGWLYWAIAALIVFLAYRLPKRRGVKFALAIGATVVVLGPMAHVAWKSWQAQARYKEALAHFEMRCKSVGERIHRPIDNVEGVVWMKWRDKYDASDDYDQFKLSDPYGRDCNAEGCIEQLLRLDAEAGRFQREVSLREGRFSFVESVDPTDGKLYRYTGTMKLPSPPWTPEAIERQQRLDGRAIGEDSYRFALERKPISKNAARYGVTWDDISTREDRERWIAGGSLKVIDLQTNEVIAERIGYMMDRAQGAHRNGPTPWAMARRHACPAYPGGMYRYPTHDSVLFALRVLQPKQ